MRAILNGTLALPEFSARKKKGRVYAMRQRRVVVIGAGPSGLVAVKELLQEGHEVICFEREDGLGGVFRFDEARGGIWESVRLTSSGLIIAFSDFPVSKDDAEFMTPDKYVRYLQRYCDHFQLAPHIRFGHTVTSVEPHAAGGWTVRMRSAHGHAIENCDALAVCSGAHQTPNIPDLPGQDTFDGEILHASQYRRPDRFRNKRVLIVGAGEAGGDIVKEIADVAAETLLSLRRGCAVFPRRLPGTNSPGDWATSRLEYTLPDWVHHTARPENRRRSMAFHWLHSVMFGAPLKLALWHARRNREAQRHKGPETAEEVNKRHAVLQELELLSGGTRYEQFGTKADAFLESLVAGTCRRVPGISHFTRRQTVFTNGLSFEPDVVLFCTGYREELPFISDEFTAAKRYKGVFVPEIGPSLGFIGHVRPNLGAIPPISELVARWFALLTSERATLPSVREMQTEIERDAHQRRTRFRAVPHRLPNLVEFTSFCDDIASKVGCKPRWSDVWRGGPEFLYRFMCGPFVSAQYRLRGPHACPAQAFSTIGSQPVVHPTAAYVHVASQVVLASALHLALGDLVKPQLTLRSREREVRG